MAVFNPRHECAVGEESHQQQEAATLTHDRQTGTASKQEIETTANQHGEYHPNSQVTCSSADPDVTRVQTAHA